MNLDDLRNHLTNQADEVDPTTPVPLPAIRHHRTTLKRRRTAAILTAAAAAVAVIAAVLPGAVNTSTPDPAKPPPDYTRDGITIRGAVGGDRLEKAEIAKPGAGTLEFRWTPSTTSLAFRPYCRSKSADKILRITVDKYLVVEQPCDDTGNSPGHRTAVPPDHVMWLQLTSGKAAEVRAFVMDRFTGEEDHSVIGLAVGIYRSVEQPKDPAIAGLPVRIPPTDPGDYLKEGFRFPAKVAGDSLNGAIVGDNGQQSLTLRFQPRLTRTYLRPFCAADDLLGAELFSMEFRVDGRPEGTIRCSDRRGDIAQEPDPFAHTITAIPGKTVVVTMQVVETATGKPFRDLPGLHIGMGAYTPGASHMFSNGAGANGIDTEIEYGGFRYGLADVRSAKVTSSREVSINVPAGKPYVIAYGGASFDPAVPVKARVLGLSDELTLDLSQGRNHTGPGRLSSTYGQPAGPANKVTLQVVSGDPANGLLFLGLYLPE